MEHRDRDSPRLVKSRVVLAGLAGALVLTVVGLGGSQVLGSLRRWLHAQKQYETSFRSIELDPPPPALYRGGRAVFLERVQEAAQRRDQPFSALDLDLAEVSRQFRLYCWVRRVRRVERKWPNRIIVRLEYRVPVARATLPGKSAPALIDEDGVILPWEDVEPETAVRAILVSVPDPPFEPRPGRAWMNSEGKVDERLLAAVKLAAFLGPILAEAHEPLSPVLQPKAIHPLAKDSLFLENDEISFIYWGEPPGAERSGTLTAREKWAMLNRWLPNRPPEPVRRPFYLAFTKAGVIVTEYRGKD
jgi:hypothetical protein